MVNKSGWVRILFTTILYFSIYYEYMFVQGGQSAWKRYIKGVASSWFGIHAGKSIVTQDVRTERVPDNNQSLLQRFPTIPS